MFHARLLSEIADLIQQLFSGYPTVMQRFQVPAALRDIFPVFLVQEVERDQENRQKDQHQ